MAVYGARSWQISAGYCYLQGLTVRNSLPLKTSCTVSHEKCDFLFLKLQWNVNTLKKMLICNTNVCFPCIVTNMRGLKRFKGNKGMNGFCPFSSLPPPWRSMLLNINRQPGCWIFHPEKCTEHPFSYFALSIGLAYPVRDVQHELN